jgi:Ca-activated chloride channel family protein
MKREFSVLTKTVITAFIAFSLVIGTFGQGQKNGSASNATQGLGSQSLHVDVDLVLVSATVTDSSNRFINGLSQTDFKLWEDKVEQQIEYFSTENTPLSVGIIFDLSGSMTDKVPAARAAANAFLRMSDVEDEFFLITFANSPTLAQDFTTDPSAILSRLLFKQAKGSTSLYDALYLGLEKVTHGSNSRRALLLITDGMDNHSRYSLNDVRQFAKEHDVMIYSIGIVSETDQINGFNGGPILESLSNLTGGVAYFAATIESLPGICAQIGADLKNKYLLGYRSSNLTSDGKWRKIRVRLNRPSRPPMQVRAKNGYYATTLRKVSN